MNNIASRWMNKFVVPSKKAWKTEGDKFDTTVDLVSAVPQITEQEKALYVVAKAEKSKYPAKGYLPKFEKGITQILQTAEKEGHVLMMRFEKKRKSADLNDKMIDELTANMDIARQSIVLVLSGVYNYSTNEWILAQDAQSDPADDPEDAKRFVRSCFLTSSVVTEEDVESFFSTPGTEQEKPASNNAGYAPKSSQFDKEQALLGMYYFVVEQEAKNNWSMPEDVRRKIALLLLSFADKLQSEMIQTDVPKYGDYSHTRARFIVFSTIENFHPLNEENIMKRGKEWKEEIYQSATETLGWVKEAAK